MIMVLLYSFSYMDIDNILIMFLYNLHFKWTTVELEKNLDVPISIGRDDQETRVFLPYYYMWIKSKKDNPQRKKINILQLRV